MYNTDDILEHEIEIGVLKNTQIYLKSRLITCRQNAKNPKQTPESVHTSAPGKHGYIETVDRNVEAGRTKQHGRTGGSQLHGKHQQRHHQHRKHKENEIHTMGKDFVVGDAHQLVNTTITTSTTTRNTPTNQGMNY